MTATTRVQTNKPEEVVDDLSNNEATGVDPAVVAMLKARQTKQEEKKMSAKIVSKKERSLAFGVVGSGQAGTKLASVWYKLGYDVVAINTAMQDLKFIDIPDSNKLLLSGTLGGAAKELDIGRSAAEANRGEIAQIVNDKLANSQVNILCLSLGGGSGAGSCETMVDVLYATGKPLVVMCVLPMESEDAQTKKNSLETLSSLLKNVQSKRVANLMCVDNAKLESIYQSVSQTEFFDVANEAIVRPLDAFNAFSAMPSSTKPLDPMEFSKLLLDGEGLSVYGELTVENYEEDTSLASAIIDSLDGNLLASGFDLKKTKYVGVVIAANKEVWSKIPSASVNYALTMLNDRCSSPMGVFKGVYVVDMPEKVVKIYSMFSGLALPDSRIEQLKKETKELASTAKSKDEQRNLSLKLDTGVEENISAAQKVKDKIASRSSNFGKFVGSISDRRK